MIKFLLRWSFFRYTNSLAYNISKGGSEILVGMFTGAICVFPLLITNGLSLNFFGAFALLWLVFIGASAFVFSAIKSCTPAMAQLQPLTLKRKILYDYIYPLYSAAKAMLAIFIFFMALSAITALITIIEGNYGGSSASGSAEDAAEQIAAQENYTGVHGGIAFASMCLSYYFAGMRAVYTPRKKIRIIYAVAYCAALIILVIITSSFAEAKGLDGSVFGEECYSATSVPWLFSIIWILLTLYVFADMLIHTVRYARRTKRL